MRTKECHDVLIGEFEESNANSTYRDDHLLHCDDCRATERLLEAMRATNGDNPIVRPLDDLSRRRLADRVLNGYINRDRIPSQNRNRTFLVAASIALVAGALGVLVGVFGIQVSVSPMANPSSVPAKIGLDGHRHGSLAGSRFVRLLGDVKVGVNLPQQGQEIPLGRLLETSAGRAVLRLRHGVAVSLSEDSSLSVGQSDGGALEVTLLQGEALFSIEPGAIQEGFTVKTRTGDIRVTGTVFTVSITSDGVRIYVHEGDVQIIDADNVEDQTGLSQTQDVHRPRLSEMTEKDKARFISRVKELGELNLGRHLPLLLADQTPSQSPIPATADNVKSHGSYATNLITPSIKDLMSQARTLKKSRNWNEATSVYKKLIALYPESNEARTSMISLGQILQEQLDRPDEALSQFERYLSGNVREPLGQEALFGKAKALRALGRIEDEQGILKQLVREYPNGIHTVAAKTRLDTYKQHQ